MRCPAIQILSNESCFFLVQLMRRWRPVVKENIEQKRLAPLKWALLFFVWKAQDLFYISIPDQDGKKQYQEVIETFESHLPLYKNIDWRSTHGINIILIVRR